MHKVDHFRVVFRDPFRITDDLAFVQYQVRQSFEKREAILLADLRVIVHLGLKRKSRIEFSEVCESFEELLLLAKRVKSELKI